MRKIAIIGSGAVGLAVEILAQAQKNEIEIVVIEKEEINKQFEPEPFLIKNYRIEPFNYYERQPSKYLSKPKFNFNKRKSK